MSDNGLPGEPVKDASDAPEDRAPAQAPGLGGAGDEPRPADGGDGPGGTPADGALGPPVNVGPLRWVMAVFHRAVRSQFLLIFLAMAISLLIGVVLMRIAGVSPIEGYRAMFKGAIYDWKGHTPERRIAPLTESVFSGVPLIVAGLGLAVGFRAGLFNIGGKGQVIMGGIAAAWVGFSYDLPPYVHLLACLAASIVAGGLYGFIAGYLKATTGANEVIVTIMLNSIAGLLIAQLLRYDAFQRPGSNEPKSPFIAENAELPGMPNPYKIDAGIIVALLAALAVWWLLERSTWGYELRAVGANPNAARTAGMSIGKVTALTMALSGALCGLAGGVTISSDVKALTAQFDGTLGFDAITVALLGRNRPGGTIAAGLLFGAFRAGGSKMQISAHVPIDMVLILQAVIVLLIAAPALVRWMFRLPKPDGLSIRKYVSLHSEKKVAA
ncbi:MAG: ABC transporter permease [Actinomycetaceae bacterium]|nr:ABC transporter permease [Actinomycetaceae bacterium]